MLPQEHIRSLFEKYKLDKKDNLGYLVVGMAPNGWIRVWFQTIDKKANDLVNIEVAKAQLRGYRDNSVGIGLKTKNFETWGNTYLYWQHHGIPYEAWANNEKEYDMYFDFNKPNKREIQFSYISSDGTFYQGEQGDVEIKVHQKLLVQIEQMPWLTKSGISYCCKVPFPKNFKKYMEQKKLREIKFRLEIEKDDEHAIMYLITKGTKEKIVRFKNKQPTRKEIEEVDYDYATEVEYFIK